MIKRISKLRLFVIRDAVGAKTVSNRLLTCSGFPCHITSDFRTACRKIMRHTFDLHVVAVARIESKTIAFVRLLRLITQKPILIVSACCDPEWRLKAMEAGANACCEQPIEDSELIARIKALLRRTLSDMPVCISLGRVVLDCRTGNVFRDGRRAILKVQDPELARSRLKRFGAILKHRLIRHHLGSR